MITNRAKIIIVAGPSPQIDILSDALKSSDYHLQRVASLAEAQKMLEGSEFDILLADVDSVGKGEANLQKIKQAHPQLGVVLITSGTNTTISKFLSANGTVTRPFRISHIEDAIREILTDDLPPKESTTILVVDDDDAFRTVLVRLLRLSGYEVQAATDGKMALELIKNGNINTVVADVNMPFMDGITLTRHIKTNWPEIPVILITGYFSAEDYANTADIVPDGFIMKPFKIKNITELLERL